MVSISEDEVGELTESLGKAPTVIKMNDKSFLPLQLKPGSSVGTVDAELYDQKRGTWTAAIALNRFKYTSFPSRRWNSGLSERHCLCGDSVRSVFHLDARFRLL